MSTNDTDVSAAQVTAYLLANGWRDVSLLPDSVLWRKFSRITCVIDIPMDRGLADHDAMMVECIEHIARAEQRHPSAVLADIVGPAVGVAGAVCQDVAPCHHPDDTRIPLSGDDWQCGLCGDYVEAPPYEERGPESPALGSAEEMRTAERSEL